MGYYAMFEYENGFRKTMYWSKKEDVAHAEKYSQAFKRTVGQNLVLLEQANAKRTFGNIPLSGSRIYMVWHKRPCAQTAYQQMGHHEH